MIQLDWPWALLCLPLPWILRVILPAASTLQDAALRVPFIEDFAADARLDKTRSLNRWLLMLASIAWVLLVLAASRPQWLGDRVDIPVSGRDLMLAVDLSGSMAEEDFAIGNQTINRLQAVKLVAGEFIKRREGDRLGLILFGERAYLQTPLTFDITTVNTLLQESLIGIAGKATAIGDAIGLSIKRLHNLDVNSRVLILLTDGRNTAGEVEPIKAAEIAAEQGLKIYTIGIGAEMVERGGFFFNRQVKNREIDEKTLTAIAEKTGGKYFRARDTEELNKIYSLLDELEPVEQESQSFRPIMALYFWPLGFAFGIVFFISLLKATGLAR